NAAGSACHHGHAAVQAEQSIIIVVAQGIQSETPLFHGMKSSCPNNSALVLISPLAILVISSRVSSPVSSTVFSPEMMGPASRSMIAGIRRANSEFVEILITGAIGLPVGVPSPVVKRTTFAPEPTCAETDSTSLPGVHKRFKPAVVAYSGKSSTAVTGDVPPF